MTDLTNYSKEALEAELKRREDLKRKEFCGRFRNASSSGHASVLVQLLQEKFNITGITFETGTEYPVQLKWSEVALLHKWIGDRMKEHGVETL